MEFLDINMIIELKQSWKRDAIKNLLSKKIIFFSWCVTKWILLLTFIYNIAWLKNYTMICKHDQLNKYMNNEQLKYIKWQKHKFDPMWTNKTRSY
jgi:hypothetical protein